MRATDLKSAELYQRARAVLPGGSTRQTVYFEPHPPYARGGSGSRVIDIDGVSRLDCLNNYSSLIHGHCHPAIVAAAIDQLQRLGAVALPTEPEVALAELLVARIASMQQVRFTNSGSEAVMMAVKAARAFTGRPKIAKIEGAYHGSYDPVEVSQSPTPDAWGPASSPASVPLCKGTPGGIVDDTVVLPFNDAAAVRRILRAHGESLAAVVVDLLPPRLRFLEATHEFIDACREGARAIGALLICDEVFSFRLARGGAQSIWGVAPDLTTLGKIIGGGFAIGAVGGRADVMAVFDASTGAPRVPHGGTFNAHPVTMCAGRAALELLDAAAYEKLDNLGHQLRDTLRDRITRAGIPAQVLGRGSLNCIVTSDRTLRDHRSLHPTPQEAARQSRLHRRLLDAGFLTGPTGLLILSTAMSTDDIDGLVIAAAQGLGQE
jgi:glutamate-1-semialdehyde 2,1-aminomutase